eukprot:COSAG02_NODE_5532_length_4250_cov_108.522525_2_plen_34_part_00
MEGNVIWNMVRETGGALTILVQYQAYTVWHILT